ncbi:disulfide bond formation protein B [Campylobacter sp. CCUG 57310]|uniref:disulfide bond formation protein B n=1 Tax=Campylobacter sp. CCUG 57310 TaxID=2517362 RepID=UPI00156746EF|nr:disulfide bond formation protein B [Campylobacter sp. CCUG 57310]QKF91503.1 disulfide bond formation protein, DsbB family [Campylobacter sp. CCUG 57310]
MGFFNEKNFDFFMATAVLLVLAIPVGIANFYLGYVIGEGPCTLCWWERMGMVVVGGAGILILRYGLRARYIAAILFAAAYGIFMTLRHASFSVYRDVGMGFGGDIFGAHTYTWGILVYWVVVVVMGIFMLFAKDKVVAEDISREHTRIKPLSKYSSFVIALSLIVVLSNAVQALISAGYPPYSGKGSPERISLNNTWTAGVWKRFEKPFSFTGSNVVEDPFIAGEPKEKSIKFSANAKDGAFVDIKPAIAVKNSFPLPFTTKGIFGKGVTSGLAYNAKDDVFGISNTEGSVYFADANFKEIAHAIIDKPNGRNIKKSVASTFVGDMLVTSGFNKTIFAVKQVSKDKIDPYKEWVTFRETTGGLEMPWHTDRPALLTIRAKKQYILTLSKDQNSNFMYMISVPNDRVKGMILIKVDTKDRLLSGETIITSSLALKEKRDIKDYYVTAGDITDGKFLAYSKNYNTLLVIDLASAKVIDAYEMPQIGDISGLAIKGDSLFTLAHKDGKVEVVELDNPLM